MQSFLQYRRFGAAARAQIDRGKAKANQANSTQSEPTSAVANEEVQQHIPRQSEANSHHGVNTTVDPESGRTVEEDGESIAGLPIHEVTTTQTRHSMRTALGHSLTGILARNRHAHEGQGGKVFVVDWEGPHDRLNPHNWSIPRRVGVTLQISLIGFFLTAASGIDATVLPQAAADLHVSQVAESLATGLYLVGMGLGSLIAGPFSETFGRNAVYTGSMAIFMIWIMASALAPNFGAQITFRFLAGCSASTPLVCAGGSIADMYDSIEKTWAFPVFAIGSFGGPMLGAVMGAYIGPSPLVSWRWTEWTILIASGLVLILVLLFMPETYGPLLLQWKAAHYRQLTGDDRFLCEHEIVDATLLTRLKVSITRPFRMLTEPIIMVMTLYITIVYIVLFTFLVGWPYIFEQTFSLDQGLANVIFVSMFVGTQANFLLVPIVYRITLKHLQGGKFSPETRLWYGMLGPSVLIPVSLFWLGWTAYSSISVWSAIFAVAFFGFAVAGIFICIYMYIIDSYEIYAASALTFVALIRYVVAGGMTVVGIPFYENMGTHYTLTILACLAVLLAPAPYLLFRYGHHVRAKSRFAVDR